MHYCVSLHTRSIRAVRCWGAILKAVLNARDTDRTSYLRHDVDIAYEMARAMTKSSHPTQLSVGTICVYMPSMP